MAALTVLADHPSVVATHATRVAWPTFDTLHVFEESAAGPLSRVVGGALTDRAVIVAEASTGALHRYDRATGAVLGRAGRLGSGPGEFRRLERLEARGNALYTWDDELRRLTVWSHEIVLQRTVPLTGEPGAVVPEPLDVFPSGELLAARIIPEEGVSANGVLLPRTASVIAPRYALSRHAPDGLRLNALTSYRGRQSFVAPNAGGGATSGGALFGRHGAAVVSGDAIVVLSSEHDTLVRMAADGRRLGVLRVPRDVPVAVQRADVARARSLAVPPGRLPFDIGAVFDQQTPPTHFPRFGWGGRVRLPVLSSTQDGSVWLLRYGGVRSRTATYLRFAANGQLRDSLRLDDEARVFDARDDLLLVGTTDDDGVERVLLLRQRTRGR